jgi:hypothetical protein
LACPAFLAGFSKTQAKLHSSGQPTPIVVEGRQDSQGGTDENPKNFMGEFIGRIAKIE